MRAVRPGQVHTRLTALSSGDWQRETQRLLVCNGGGSKAKEASSVCSRSRSVDRWYPRTAAGTKKAMTGWSIKRSDKKVLNFEVLGAHANRTLHQQPERSLLYPSGSLGGDEESERVCVDAVGGRESGFLNAGREGDAQPYKAGEARHGQTKTNAFARIFSLRSQSERFHAKSNFQSVEEAICPPNIASSNIRRVIWCIEHCDDSTISPCHHTMILMPY
jgi:hypothetical protein